MARNVITSYSLRNEEDAELFMIYYMTTDPSSIGDYNVFGVEIEKYVRKGEDLIFAERAGERRITDCSKTMEEIIHKLADNTVMPVHFYDCIDLIINSMEMTA